MATVVNVINNALRRLGASVITSLDDGSESANSVNDVYDEILDDLLRSHTWNFATKRVKISRLSGAPVFGDDYAYALPADWVRTVSAHPDDSGTGTLDFKEETQDDSNVLVTSAESVYLRYIARIADPNRMPPDFRKALSRLIAEAVCVDLAASSTLRETIEQENRGLLRRAKSADALGSTPEKRPRGSWAVWRRRWRQ